MTYQRKTPRDSQIHNKIHTGSGMTKGKRQCQIDCDKEKPRCLIESKSGNVQWTYICRCFHGKRLFHHVPSHDEDSLSDDLIIDFSQRETFESSTIFGLARERRENNHLSMNLDVIA